MRVERFDIEALCNNPGNNIVVRSQPVRTTHHFGNVIKMSPQTKTKTHLSFSCYGVKKKKEKDWVLICAKRVTNNN